MLVLSRHVNEVIMIGDDIKIKVISVRNDMVRLGIDAPRAVAVHREEVWRRIEDRAAAGRAADERRRGERGRESGTGHPD
jgi:carbon storage regulator